MISQRRSRNCHIAWQWRSQSITIFATNFWGQPEKVEGHPVTWLDKNLGRIGKAECRCLSFRMKLKSGSGAGGHPIGDRAAGDGGAGDAGGVGPSGGVGGADEGTGPVLGGGDAGPVEADVVGDGPAEGCRSDAGGDVDGPGDASSGAVAGIVVEDAAWPMQRSS
jgi:hypothetical protein